MLRRSSSLPNRFPGGPGKHTGGTAAREELATRTPIVNRDRVASDWKPIRGKLQERYGYEWNRSEREVDELARIG
jgi:hypothetical protein